MKYEDTSAWNMLLKSLFRSAYRNKIYNGDQIRMEFGACSLLHIC